MATQPETPLGFPVFRNFDESLDGQMIGYAVTERDAIKVAVGAGVKGLKIGGRPKLLEYVGGKVWLLED